MLSALLLEQEHYYGFRFIDFVKGYYTDGHPTMPGMAYLELKGSLITKGNKIKGSVATLFESRNSHRLVQNPNDLLSPYRLYELLHGFTHPYQEFIYCYKANRALLDQYTSQPDCRGFQANPASPQNWEEFYWKVLRKTPQKSPDQERASLQKPLLARVGFGNGCQQSNVKMAKQMAFSQHSNATSHITCIKAGHNSDLSFQKAISGAPMPKKKDIEKMKDTAAKVAKMAKMKLKNVIPIQYKAIPRKAKVVLMPNKVITRKAKVIHRAKPPKAPSYMKHR
jgi:hypothetical protein